MKKSKTRLDAPEVIQHPAGPEKFTRAQYLKALSKLKGKDALGRAGELLGTAGGVAAGASAAGAIAGAAGATTFLGSTTIAGVVGGVFVTVTPVGWILGSAVVAGMAAYGLAKMVRSGARQDETREKLSKSIRRKVEAMDCPARGQSTEENSYLDLKLKLTEAVKTGALSEENSRRILSLVDRNALNVDVAIDRVAGLSHSFHT